ncbi:MAG TPA: oligosaccharide flippase family protein [Polyangiales bacterium]|nr:oligosaccharide flippase family protein [Polyangiales bacterium]
MSDSPGSEQRRHSRDAGVLVMGKLLATLSDALLPLVIVRLLGKSEVGVLTSVLLIYTTIALVLSTGFPPALMFHLPGRPAPERRAIATQMALGLFCFGVIAALLLTASGLLGSFAPGLVRWLARDNSAALLNGGLSHMFLLAAFPLGDLPARMLPNLLVIENRTDTAARYAIASSVGSAAFVLLPASLGASIQTVLLAYSALGILQGLALLWFMRELYRGIERAPAPIPFRETVRFAVPLGLTDIVAVLNSRFDRYLISVSFPLAAFAEYQVGAFQIPILTTVAYTVGTVYTPLLTELFREGKAAEAIATWRESVNKVTLIVVPIAAVFVVAAEEFVELLFTPAYLAAAPVFRCYALLTMGRVASFGTVLVAAGRPQLILRAAIYSLLANAALCLIGLKVFGFVGPAIGVAVAFVPMVVIYCAYIAQAAEQPLGGIFPLANYLKVAATAAVAAIPAVLAKQWLPWPALPRMAAVAVVLLALFSLLGSVTRQIKREDWQYLANWLRFRVRE